MQKTAITAMLSGFLLMPATSVQADDPTVSILRVGSQPSVPADAKYFTGVARVDSRFQRSEPAKISGGLVTFEPGARTAWHSHPLGQTLIVTSGVGWVQSWGGAVQEFREGDVVWIPPEVKHWHGATATTGMSHFAVSESLNGKSVVWMDKVSDEQYLAK
ncbi:MAG: cupin domain-containing protein [Formivibrio sp.]|nr:cupin domain-containing protein [Formivibrio sp.]